MADPQIVSSWHFWLQVGVLVFIAIFPVFAVKFVVNVLNPPAHSKVNE
jgi:lauroyl/myristoyl acyltransferase